MAKNRSSLGEGCPSHRGGDGALYAISSELDRELDKLMDVFCAGKLLLISAIFGVVMGNMLFYLYCR
jgi:hypothetical protein